jgi:hypothetical protein
VTARKRPSRPGGPDSPLGPGAPGAIAQGGQPLGDGTLDLAFQLGDLGTHACDRRRGLRVHQRPLPLALLFGQDLAQRFGPGVEYGMIGRQPRMPRTVAVRMLP